MTNHVLTLNAGSSSLKFALFSAGEDWPRRIASGEIEALGSTPRFHAQIGDARNEERTFAGRDHAAAIKAVVHWVEAAFPDDAVAAVGHRIVHGGAARAEPLVADEALFAELKTLEPLAPLHQPHNLAGLDAAWRAFPNAPQVVCFDTAFHRGHAFVNDAYALPRAYYDKGVRRFGFHGLSYEYIARRMRELEPVLACGRIVALHLGAGASLCAMKNGVSVASTMGFSPLDGVPMGTRCGQIDPGALLYLLDHENMSTAELTDLLYRKSGLKGLSGLSADMRELEASRAPAAKEAIDYFAHRVRMEIGALTAALGGLDALVFTAGIGEHSAKFRAKVCDGLGWLGVRLDAGANAKGETRISTQRRPVPAFVLPTDEEAMIALHTMETVGITPKRRVERLA